MRLRRDQEAGFSLRFARFESGGCWRLLARVSWTGAFMRMTLAAVSGDNQGSLAVWLLAASGGRWRRTLRRFSEQGRNAAPLQSAARPEAGRSRQARIVSRSRLVIHGRSQFFQCKMAEHVMAVVIQDAKVVLLV